MISRFPCRASLWRALGLACLLVGSPALHALEFEEAVALAERQSPGLAAQASAVAAARHQAEGAHRLPAPRLAVGVENLPISGMDRWSLSRDFMTMQRLALMQDIPNQGLRDARRQGAQARAERDQAGAEVQRRQLRLELLLAWQLVQRGEQRIALLAELLAENQRLIDSLPALVSGGTATAAELLMARQERLMLSDRDDEARRDIAKARAALRRWLGERSAEPLAALAPLPRRDPDALRERWLRHVELAAFPAMLRMAQAELREVDAEDRGDWSWELAYNRRGRQWGDMVSFQLSFALPWDRKNRLQPQLSGKQRELERVEQERQEMQRRLLQSLDEQLAEQATLTRQIERQSQQILPLARQRAELSLSSYQAGRGSLPELLSARAAVLEARLREIDLMAAQDALRAQLETLILE